MHRKLLSFSPLSSFSSFFSFKSFHQLFLDKSLVWCYSSNSTFFRISVFICFLLLYFIPQSQAACMTCNVSACDPWFLFYTSDTDTSGCDTINNVGGISFFESPTPQCRGNVLPWMCAGLRKTSEVNQNASCPNPSLPEAKTCQYWCLKVAACISDPGIAAALACDDSTRWAPPDQPCNNVSEADVQRAPKAPYTPENPRHIPQCAKSTDSADPKTQMSVSLGPYYALSQNTSCPPIPQVRLDIPFSKLFAPECSQHNVQRPAYANYFYFFMPFIVVTLGLYFWRREMWPINARNGPLIYAFVFFLIFCYLLFMEYEIYGTSAECQLLAVASTMAGPLFFMPLALRAFRLVFLYRWNTNKRRTNKRDWYFDHRWLISPKTTIIIMIINCILCTCAAFGILFSRPNLKGAILETGYCQWFNFTPEVIAFYNQTYGTPDESALNPWGFGPYSPNLSTCVFCELGKANVYAILGWNFSFIFLILVCIVVLRNINDQYWLWREIMLVSIANVVLFPFAVIASYEPARKAMNMEQNDFIGKVVVSVTTFDYFCTIVLPLVLSFTRQAQNGRQGSKRTREVSRVGPTSVSGFITVDPKAEKSGQKFLMEVDAHGKVKVSMDLDDVVEDPVGLEALRNFAVELFKAELVEFYIRAKNYQRIKKEDQMQIEASNIYHTYIKEGAVLQINISYKQRQKFDKLCKEGHFNYSSLEASMTSSDFGTLGLGGHGLHIKTDIQPKNTPVDHTPTNNRGGGTSGGYSDDVSPSPTPSHPGRALFPQNSEYNFDRLHSSTYSESGAGNVKKSIDSSDTKSLVGESGKLISSQTTDASDKPFRAIDFSEPLREVRQLIYDDWGRFTTSKHWEVFVRDLQQRVQSPSNDEFQDQGVTELHPEENTPTKLPRVSSYRASKSAGPSPTTPVSPGEQYKLEPSVENTEVNSDNGPEVSVTGRNSRVVKSKSVGSFANSHPDAA